MKLLAVDGTNLTHRFFHGAAASDMRDADGAPIWAVNGVFGAIARLVTEHRPSHLLVAFDPAGGCDWRRELHPGYKAGRSAPAPDLTVQLDSVERLCAAAGLLSVSITGAEADDVLASAVDGMSASLSVVVSSDKDLLQLVSQSTVVVNPTSGVFDEKRVCDKFGVPAKRLVEYAALVGERSDNLPGVAGIGPKAAARILTYYPDVDCALFDDDVDAKLGAATAAKLRAGIESFRMCRRVATLDRTLQVDVDAGAVAHVDRRDLHGCLAAAGIEHAAGRLSASLAASAAAWELI